MRIGTWREEKTNMYVLFGTPKGKKKLGRHSHKRLDNEKNGP